MSGIRMDINKYLSISSALFLSTLIIETLFLVCSLIWKKKWKKIWKKKIGLGAIQSWST